MNCPNCRATVPPGAAFCDNCGASLAGAAPPPPSAAAMAPTAMAGGARCPACGAAVIPGEAFCDACGASLANTPPAAAPMPQPPAQGGWSAPPAAPVAPMAPPPQSFAGAPAGGTVCPTCGTPSTPGQAFCDNCGASLAAPPGAGSPPLQQTPPPLQQTPPPYQQAAGTRPRVVVVGSGVQIDLAGKTEAIMGRADPVSGVFPEVDLAAHGGEEGGVSRKHAKLALRGGQWMLEDLNAVNFTFLNNQKLSPGAPQPVKEGDQIRLGRVLLSFHTS
jgi:predicted amidophosphoribosyltransferase